MYFASLYVDIYIYTHTIKVTDVDKIGILVADQS